jgi:hypothetical protein
VATYRIAATNTSRSRYGETGADTETDALEKARNMSRAILGVSFGVFEVRDGAGSFLVAAFLNGERRFTAREEG